MEEKGEEINALAKTYSEIFEHGFDNHVGILELRVVKGRIESGHELVLLVGGDLLPLGLLAEVLVDLILTPDQTFGEGVFHDDLLEVFQRNLADSCAHQAGSENGDVPAK